MLVIYTYDQSQDFKWQWKDLFSCEAYICMQVRKKKYIEMFDSFTEPFNLLACNTKY